MGYHCSYFGRFASVSDDTRNLLGFYPEYTQSPFDGDRKKHGGVHNDPKLPKKQGLHVVHGLGGFNWGQFWMTRIPLDILNNDDGHRKVFRPIS